MDNNCNNKNNAQNCGKNNKPTNVKQDNKNKTDSSAQNVKQDNKNSTYRSDKLFNDTATGGNRPSRNSRRDDGAEF